MRTVCTLNGVTEGAEEAVEVCALFWQEASVLAVATPILDVEFTVADIEVAHDHG